MLYFVNLKTGQFKLASHKYERSFMCTSIHSCVHDHNLCRCEESMAQTFLHDWLRRKTKPNSEVWKKEEE